MRPWYLIEGFVALPVVLQLLGVGYLLMGRRAGWLYLASAHVLWGLYNHVSGRDHLVIASALFMAAYATCYVYWPRVWRPV